MAHTICFKKEINGTVADAIQKLTENLKAQGFGVLTRIDMHEKFKEKLGKQVPPVVILGACNPQFAFDAFSRSTDVTALLPCNAVVRELGPGRVSIELAKPSALMKILDNPELTTLAMRADAQLAQVLERFNENPAAGAELKAG